MASACVRTGRSCTHPYMHAKSTFVTRYFLYVALQSTLEKLYRKLITLTCWCDTFASHSRLRLRRARDRPVCTRRVPESRRVCVAPPVHPQRLPSPLQKQQHCRWWHCVCFADHRRAGKRQFGAPLGAVSTTAAERPKRSPGAGKTGRTQRRALQVLDSTRQLP